MNSSDILRKRLYYQSWHRGTKEADLLLGGFADVYLSTFNEDELRDYESLLTYNDVDIFDWLQDSSLSSPVFNTHVAQRLKQWAQKDIKKD